METRELKNLEEEHNSKIELHRKALAKAEKRLSNARNIIEKNISILNDRNPESRVYQAAREENRQIYMLMKNYPKVIKKLKEKIAFMEEENKTNNIIDYGNVQIEIKETKSPLLIYSEVIPELKIDNENKNIIEKLAHYDITYKVKENDSVVKHIDDVYMSSKIDMEKIRMDKEYEDYIISLISFENINKIKKEAEPKNIQSIYLNNSEEDEEKDEKIKSVLFEEENRVNKYEEDLVKNNDEISTKDIYKDSKDDYIGEYQLPNLFDETEKSGNSKSDIEEINDILKYVDDTEDERISDEIKENKFSKLKNSKIAMNAKLFIKGLFEIVKYSKLGMFVSDKIYAYKNRRKDNKPENNVITRVKKNNKDFIESIKINHEKIDFENVLERMENALNEKKKTEER